MRLGIDACCWSNQRGYGRFTRGLVHALLGADTSLEISLFVDSHTAARVQLPAAAHHVIVPTLRASTDAASATSNRSLRDMWAMTRAVARSSVDAFFFPSVYTYFPVLPRMTVVLGVHDVIAEDYPELVFPMRWRRWLWKAKARAAHGQADYVVTVSEYSKEGISRRFRCPDDRIWVVEEAPDPVFRPLSADEIDASLLARWGLSRESRFLAYLGGVNPHKNVPLLIEALAELRQDSRYQDVKLILIGDDRSDRFTPGLEMVEARIGALGLNHAVRFTGFLPDADVAQLLNVAKALVLPSFAEGFGLPAIEAAACATPVVATQNSPLPSLLEGGGIFIDPARKEMLTRALAVLVDNESERLRLGTRAREQAAKLTWERSARQLQALLQEVERRKR